MAISGESIIRKFYMLCLITISISNRNYHLPPKGWIFFLLFFYTTAKLIMLFGVGLYEKDTGGGS